MGNGNIYNRAPGPSYVSACAFKTKVGMIPDSNKVNQDAYIVSNNFCKQSDCFFFSVLDGHGMCGREVSQFLKQRLPAVLQQDANFFYDPSRSMTAGILKVAQELLRQNFDIQFSGSTLVATAIIGKKLFCANVGDSRATLVRGGQPIELMREHKPDLEDEAQRIRKQNGRIQAYKDEDGSDIGPKRVWLADVDIPGLAMSRSMGDAIAQSVGVTSEPEIFEFDLVPEDAYMIIASDGVCEFITNEEAIQITSQLVAAGNLQ